MGVSMDFIPPGSIPENHFWIDLFRAEYHASTPRIEGVPLQLKRSFTWKFRDWETDPAASGGLVRVMMRASAGAFAEKKH